MSNNSDTKQYKLPKDFEPSKNDFYRLGFKIESIPFAEHFCNVIFPQGWTYSEERPDYIVRAHQNRSIPSWYDDLYGNICDEQGRLRGTTRFRYQYILGLTARYTKLYHRYGMNTEHQEGNEYTLYFGNPNEKLFVAGNIKYSNDPLESSGAFELKKQLEAKVLDFASQNYPDWQNVQAYWDKPKQKTPQNG